MGHHKCDHKDPYAQDCRKCTCTSPPLDRAVDRAKQQDEPTERAIIGDLGHPKSHNENDSRHSCCHSSHLATLCHRNVSPHGGFGGSTMQSIAARTRNVAITHAVHARQTEHPQVLERYSCITFAIRRENSGSFTEPTMRTATLPSRSMMSVLGKAPGGTPGSLRSIAPLESTMLGYGTL